MAYKLVLGDLPLRRVGARWNTAARAREALYAACPCCLASITLELGTAIYPQDDDLPFLMVVTEVDAATGIITASSFDQDPPPTLYFHQEPTSWPPLT